MYNMLCVALVAFDMELCIQWLVDGPLILNIISLSKYARDIHISRLIYYINIKAMYDEKIYSIYLYTNW